MYKNFKKDELYKFKEAFNIFDIRQTGMINAEDLPSLLAILHISPTKKDLKLISEEYSTTVDNKIKYKDFLAIMNQLKHRKDNKMLLNEAFENIMETTDTSISVDRLREVLTTKGEVLTNDEFDLFVQEADPQKTGKVQYKQFIDILIK